MRVRVYILIITNKKNTFAHYAAYSWITACTRTSTTVTAHMLKIKPWETPLPSVERKKEKRKKEKRSPFAHLYHLKYFSERSATESSAALGLARK